MTKTIKYVSKKDFINKIKNSNVYKDNFTINGLSWMYDYFKANYDIFGEMLTASATDLCCTFAIVHKNEAERENMNIIAYISPARRLVLK